MGQTVREDWAEIDSGRLHYLRAGDRGPPVVLLHGGIIDAAALSWGHLLEPLADGRRVYALDLPGYGESDLLAGTYATAFHVDALADFLAEIGLADPHLVGVSLGGAVALGHALRSPESVASLVPIASYGLGRDLPNGRLSYLLSRAPALNRISVALMRRSRSVLEAGLGNVVSDADRLPDSVVDEFAALVAKPNAGVAFRRWRKREVGWNGYRTDYTDRLSELAVPTTFVHGAEDDVFPVSWARRAAERVPEARLHVIDDCGHWVPRDHPEKCRQILTETLPSA
jgi:pimeloyl-ACP methyl ester carboxylesterase